MTPSMPGFVFNAYPETPPVPHHLMSPGSMAPFSPGIPITSPTGFQYNPFLNAAPGAPVGRPNGNGTQSGSAALGTPTTQVFPGNNIHGFGAPGAPGRNMPQSIGQAVGDYFPSMNGNGYAEAPILASPTARLSFSQARKEVNLNAKDRLASTTTVADQTNKLAERAAQMSLDPSTSSSEARDAISQPPAPIGTLDSPSGAASGYGGINSRASIDGGMRPMLGVWEQHNGERGASFGDIASGRGSH